ncbi:MAG TPA: hypothetical protein VNW53_09410 [Phenylobacterium sp.]|jgi:hypothetical protein|uniref:hypothetical protein n=1 Tax=Phenylobacterium sp. TaxID=1871053 RepID=UPI002BB74883|nr:hypothetical protein [Phenylobacterium sp.]HXA39205.1 hypothetical protein [Phenylobacterium sp.]
MKTHEVARMLTLLASALKRGPNVPLEDLGTERVTRAKPDPSTIPVALGTLVALSEIDKQQWLDLIRENGFPIELRPRDASRDILGKVLRYLEQNPAARQRLTNSPRERSTTSPELRRALDILLKS